MKNLFLNLLLAGGLALVSTTATAQCNSLLESCATANPGSMAGFTLVDAAYDNLDGNGGKLKITMYKGNTYRFLACKANEVPALVIGILSPSNEILATNLTEDESGVYRMIDFTCNATAEYQLMMIPYNGTGCCGVIYAMK
jgi:hypothetical protein